MKLLEPTGGRILFRGRDHHASLARRVRPYRREMMMIFRTVRLAEPPQRVGFIVAGALELHKLGTSAEIKRRVQGCSKSSA